MGSRCEIGSRSDDPCPHSRTNEVLRWGINWQIEVCDEHAQEALSDGCEVFSLETSERTAESNGEVKELKT